MSLEARSLELVRLYVAYGVAQADAFETAPSPAPTVPGPPVLHVGRSSMIGIVSSFVHSHWVQPSRAAGRNGLRRTILLPDAVGKLALRRRRIAGAGWIVPGRVATPSPLALTGAAGAG